jgi:hypothetical protein
MRSHRRGVSLVELLIVMSACTLVLTLSIALIHRMMRIQSNARSFEQVERSALRLSTHFRQDVHEAQDATPNAASAKDGVFLRLEGDQERSIEYRLDDSAIIRRCFNGDKLIGQEAFDFGTSVEIDIQEETSPRTLTLSLAERPTPTVENGAVAKSVAYSRPIAFRVTAIVGRLARFPVVDEEEAK